MTRHRFDALSFVFGALFAAVAVAGLSGPWTLRELDLAWLGPGLLVLLGLVVLLTALSPRPRPADHDAPAGPGSADGGPVGAPRSADAATTRELDVGGPRTGEASGGHHEPPEDGS